MEKGAVSGPSKLIPLVPSTEGWHLTVVDFSLQGSTWRHLVSIDGSGWQNIGSGHNADLPNGDSKCSLILNLESVAAGSEAIIDEAIVWAGHDVFTDNELSNLYELVNTYNNPMSAYGSIFGTPINSGVDYFVHGYIQTSGDISLYIPSQKEIDSIDLSIDGHIQTSGDISLCISGTPTIASSSITLYTLAPSPANSGIDLYITGPLSESGNVNHFIYGHQTSSSNVDQYTRGHLPFSGSVDLYVSGIPAISSSIILYTVGPLPSSGNTDDFIWGHLPLSGDSSLFIKGLFPTFDAFVSTVENNPSNNVDLFTHGVPPGESTTFYVNNSISLFINDSGDDTTVDSSWSSFIKVDDAIAVDESGVWPSFVRGGNVANDNIAMYINSHASGEAPRGILTTNSRNLFIEGQSLQGGDEGLLNDGYSSDNLETLAFAKVHLGLNDTINMYISGAIVAVPPSASLDLFTFGISGVQSDSFTLYMFGLTNTNNEVNLFVLGIQDISSGNAPLYIEVTDIGLLDNTVSLYSHGF